MYVNTSRLSATKNPKKYEKTASLLGDFTFWKHYQTFCCEIYIQKTAYKMFPKNIYKKSINLFSTN